MPKLSKKYDKFDLWRHNNVKIQDGGHFCKEVPITGLFVRFPSTNVLTTYRKQYQYYLKFMLQLTSDVTATSKSNMAAILGL